MATYRGVVGLVTVAMAMHYTAGFGYTNRGIVKQDSVMKGFRRRTT